MVTSSASREDLLIFTFSARVLRVLRAKFNWGICPFAHTALRMDGGAMMNIPSDEDFARAKRMMANESRNLDMVDANVKQRFMAICQFHNIFILPQRDVNFRAYVFFKRDCDLEDCKRKGITQDIVQFVRDELERVGHGKNEETSVAFEFDSDENVDRKYGGDYFDRLR